MPICIIVDVDGTIADNRHRLHHIKKEPKDYPTFHKACVEDKPIAFMIELLQSLRYSQKHYPIMLCTGRPDTIRAQTVAWFQDHNVPWDGMLMRAADDHRPNVEVKLDQLKELREKGYVPLFAIDDDPRLVQMWRENGVPCLAMDDINWQVHEDNKREVNA